MTMYSFEANVYLFAIVYYKMLSKKDPFYDSYSIEDILER